jgi:glycosyltransferase involved in cell wall biosynthesis
MKNIGKKIQHILPRPLRFLMYKIYEDFFVLLILLRYSKLWKFVGYHNRHVQVKKRILFYHISGLSFGGTEKALQIIAKHINKEKYDVFFMYSSKPRVGASKVDGRKDYFLNSGVTLINFDYTKQDITYPHIAHDVKPSIFEILEKEQIDLLFTAASGYSEYPFNILKKLPILLINIFGSPSTQKNIKKHICISDEVAEKIRPVVSEDKIDVIYIQSEAPITGSYEVGQKIRADFGIASTDFAFGRIGRADNGIFDPIGIEAFKKIQKEYPTAHYIIMSPPPILVEMVEKEQIKNVHFLKPSSDEKDIWAFHQSIDCLAHFRKDGESCGLNIAESMLCGKPILSHRSHQWNAHTEYLDSNFSLVANIDNIEQYADNMRYMIKSKKSGTIIAMGQKAREKAEKLFLIQNNIEKIEQNIENAI